MKIVSGGQTGVDRAALDAALEVGVPAGGWCPDGRKAEDGAISDRYPLKELPGGGYRARTKKNVQDSDGTMIIYFGEPTGGTTLTVQFCQALEKPHVLIDGERLSEAAATQNLREFISQYSIDTLNVAGPRASGDARAYPFAHDLMLALLR